MLDPSGSGGREAARSGLLAFSGDRLHRRAALARVRTVHAFRPGLVESCSRLRVRSRGLKLRKGQSGQIVRHVDAAGGYGLGASIVESDLEWLLVPNCADKQGDRKIALDERALTERHVGMAIFNGLQILGRQIVAAGDEFVGIAGVELAQA